MTEAGTEARGPAIDIRDERHRADPYPAYARLREEARVHRVGEANGLQSWRVNRYDDVRELLGDRRLSKDPRTARRELDRAGIAEQADPLDRTMLSTDPPEHTRLRRVVSRAFTPRRVDERMRPVVQAITDGLLDEMAPRDEVDLIQALALPLPVHVICELLGVPEGDREQFRSWFTPDAAPGAREGWWGAGGRYLAGLVAERRRTADAGLAEDEQPDLISALVTAADDGDRLTEREVVGTLTLLLIAGHETTINLLASGMLALFEHPDQLRLLRDRPELAPSAVEELARYTNPVQRGSFRCAIEDVQIGDVTIPAGAVVSAGIASANRDPRRFADPDRLDIARADNHHLAFGHGIHFCLGAPLARVEGQIAFTSLLRRFPDIALACPLDEVRWRPLGFLRGLAALPVRLR